MNVVVDACMLDGLPSGAATRLSALADEHARRNEMALTYLVRPGVQVLSGHRRREVTGLDTPWGRGRAGARLDVLLEEEEADLYCAGALPLARLARVPQVLTLHDLRFLQPGTGQAPWRRVWGRFRLRPNLDRAAALVAVSRSTADALVQRVGCDAARVSVIPNAATPGLQRVSDPEALAAFRRRAGVNARYVLALGPLEAHKNPGLLLEALLRARDHADGADLVLVLAGRADPAAALTVSRRAQQLGLDAALRITGVLDAADLAAALSGADALLAVGRSEGFAIPVVDAQGLGVPVVAIESGALPEVCGDGAWLAVPDDADGLAAAILGAVTPGDLREARLRRALELVGRWSWERSARQLEQLWERVLRAGVA